MEQSVIDGTKQLFEVSPLVTALVLFILVLLWYINRLHNDSKEDRVLMRELIKDYSKDMKGNTAALIELKEIVRYDYQANHR